MEPVIQHSSFTIPLRQQTVKLGHETELQITAWNVAFDAYTSPLIEYKCVRWFMWSKLLEILKYSFSL